MNNRFLTTPVIVFICCMVSYSRVPTNGLVAYYSFDAIDTTVIDSSDNGNYGTAVDVLPAANRFGKEASAGSFNGANSHITVKDANSLRPTTITISAWVKLNSLGYDRKVVGKNLNNGISDSYNLGIYADDKIEFFVYNNGWYGVRGISGGTTVKTGVWYHMTGVYDGNAVTTYLNAVVDRRNVVGNIPIQYNASPLIIGQTPTAQYLNGVIDDIRIYNRALSTAEIQSIFTNAAAAAPVLIPYAPNPTFNRRPLLRWLGDSTIPQYRVHIATDSLFSLPVVSVPTSDTFYRPTADLPTGVVYWRVGNEYNSTFTLWSSMGSIGILDTFATILIPYSPDPTRERKPTLTWRRVDDASSYMIQIGSAPSFANPFISTATTDTFFTPTINLPVGTVYWHVKSNLNAQYSFSDTFTLLNDSIPLLIPITPDTQRTRRPGFRWRQATGATSYRIQIDTLGNFSVPYISFPLTDTTFSPDADLPIGRIFWRVGATTNPTRYSDVDTFMIAAQTAVAPKSVPTRALSSAVSFIVCRHGASIGYSCVKPTEISLDIFTLSGDRTATVAATFVPAGRHTLSWNGHDMHGRALSAGSYLFIFRIGRQMVLKKTTMIW